MPPSCRMRAARWPGTVAAGATADALGHDNSPSSSGRLGSLILDRKRLSGDAELTVSISLHCLARFFRRQASNPLARHGDSMAVTGKRLCAPAIQTGARPRPAGNSACRPRSLYGVQSCRSGPAARDGDQNEHF